MSPALPPVPPPAKPAPALNVGIVLSPHFTLLALSAFVDTLRLAADSRDRSRPIRCAWRLMSADGRRVQSSSGVWVEPHGAHADPAGFDYVVIVGGTLHHDCDMVAQYDYLRLAARRQVPLVGLCTGSFHLARAGLMEGYRACVSWLHKDELESEFPRLDVDAEALYVFDRDRITCAGGTSVLHLASQLIERHLGKGASAKGLRIMLEEGARSAGATQPPPSVTGLEAVADHRLRRAMLLIERRIETGFDADAVASAVGLSVRQLNRLFHAQLGCSPGAYSQRLRLERADRLVRKDHVSMTEIAGRCGFADAAHFSRAYRSRFALSPRQARQQARMSS